MTVGEVSAVRAETRPASPASVPWWRRDTFLIAAITVLTAVLVLFRIGAKSFWQDEAFTWSSVHRSWPDFVRHVRTSEAGGAIYLAFTWFWSRISNTEGFLRLPSALCAIATIPVVAVLAKRLFDARVGVLAALFLAVNANLLQYGQEARTYSFAILLGALAMLGFVMDLERPRVASFVLWTVPAGLLLWAQPLAASVVLAQAAALPFLPEVRARLRRLVWAAVTIAAVSLPIAVMLLTQSVDQRPFLEYGRTPVAIARAAATMAGKAGAPLILVYAALLGFALWLGIGIMRRRIVSTGSFHFALLAAWLVLPLVAAVAGSYREPVFAARYLLFGLPALPILGAWAVMSIPIPWLRILTGALVVVLGMVGVVRWYVSLPKDDWRGVARTLEQQARPGDGLVTMGDEGRVPLEYYLRDKPRVRRDLVPAYPAQAWTHFRTGDETLHLPTVARLHAIGGRFDRVWVVVARGPAWPQSEGDGAARARLRKGLAPELPSRHCRAYEGSLSLCLYRR